jgi:3-oxoacyl-[acyl-carrier-protein] synthase III
MRWSSVFVAGTGTCLPSTEPVEDAIRRGQYKTSDAKRQGHLAASVARRDDFALRFAVIAAREALARADTSPAEVDVLLHAVTLEGGVTLANSASYIQRELGDWQQRSYIAELRACCAGGVLAIDDACARLTATDAAVALITASDRWEESVIDRWSSLGPGVVFGDGGGAVVLSTKGGWGKIKATSVQSDPWLEGLLRGQEPFGCRTHDAPKPIDLNRRGRDFLRSHSRDEMWARRADGLCAAVEEVLTEGEISLPQLQFIAPSFIGRAQLAAEVLDPLGISIEQTTWQYGRNIGHMGGADPLVGLSMLAEHTLQPGDHVLLVGVGGGFVWATALVEVLAMPRPGKTQSSVKLMADSY